MGEGRGQDALVVLRSEMASGVVGKGRRTGAKRAARQIIGFVPLR